MKPAIITTADGSHTLKSSLINDTYHSSHGAITESQVVYIEYGLNKAFESFSETIILLEVGFGTGLNALLTAIEAEKQKRNVYYIAIESEPINVELACSLNYPKITNYPLAEVFFNKIHNCEWGKPLAINNFMKIIKIRTKLQEIDFGKTKFNLIYYDAFGPDNQPEMWLPEIFEDISKNTVQGGIFTTYSTKGDVKRALKTYGFKINKLAGPPGKREVLRAIKI